MTEQERQRRWYHVTPDRLFVGLLVGEGLFFLSDRFGWFGFTPGDGSNVLRALMLGGVALLIALGAVIFRRRSLRFNLRTLLLFVVVVSVPMGWFAWRMQKARKQREAVEAIVALGGLVYYDCGNETTALQPPTPRVLQRFLGDDFFWDVDSISCIDLDFGNEEMAHVKGLSNLRGLSIGGTPITDAGLVHLEELPKLEALSLSTTHVTDAGMKHLRKMTELEGLWLDGTQVTDAGLEHLGELSKLEYLYLSRTGVTDAGLKQLRKLTNLQVLDLAQTEVGDADLEHLERLPQQTLILNDTKVTDDGLRHLQTLTSTGNLYILRSHVTDKGVVKLQQAWPNCRIEH
jgi:hypothetical protein